MIHAMFSIYVQIGCPEPKWAKNGFNFLHKWVSIKNRFYFLGSRLKDKHLIWVIFTQKGIFSFLRCQFENVKDCKGVFKLKKMSFVQFISLIIKGTIGLNNTHSGKKSGAKSHFSTHKNAAKLGQFLPNLDTKKFPSAPR